jgi:hypothetical protein
MSLAGGSSLGARGRARFVLAPQLPQDLIRGFRGNTLAGAKDPDSFLFMQTMSVPPKVKEGWVLRSLQVGRIAGTKLELVVNWLGQSDPTGSC